MMMILLRREKLALMLAIMFIANFMLRANAIANLCTIGIYIDNNPQVSKLKFLIHVFANDGRTWQTLISTPMTQSSIVFKLNAKKFMHFNLTITEFNQNTDSSWNTIIPFTSNSLKKLGEVVYAILYQTGDQHHYQIVPITVSRIASARKVTSKSLIAKQNYAATTDRINSPIKEKRVQQVMEKLYVMQATCTLKVKHTINIRHSYIDVPIKLKRCNNTCKNLEEINTPVNAIVLPKEEFLQVASSNIQFRHYAFSRFRIFSLLFLVTANIISICSYLVFALEYTSIEGLSQKHNRIIHIIDQHIQPHKFWQLALQQTLLLSKFPLIICSLFSTMNVIQIVILVVHVFKAEIQSPFRKKWTCDFTGNSSKRLCN
jgi:hypothetical protein